MFYLLYKHQWNTKPHFTLIAFYCERCNLSCSHSNGDLFTCEDNVLSSRVKILLGKLPSKEQQLSRTQLFILKAHAAIFGLLIQYGPRGTPLTPMIQRQNYLLSTSSLSKKTINMLICFEK